MDIRKKVNRIFKSCVSKQNVYVQVSNLRRHPEMLCYLSHQKCIFAPVINLSTGSVVIIRSTMDIYTSSQKK